MPELCNIIISHWRWSTPIHLEAAAEYVEKATPPVQCFKKGNNIVVLPDCSNLEQCHLQMKLEGKTRIVAVFSMCIGFGNLDI